MFELINTVMIDGLPHKIGRHGKAFVFINDHWKLSAKPASEVHKALRHKEES